VILIYLLEYTGPFNARATARLATLRAAGDQVAISDLTRLECRVKPMQRGDAAGVLQYDRFFAQPDVRLVPLSAAVYDRATAIRATHGFKTIDALHLAAAVEAGCGSFLERRPAEPLPRHCRGYPSLNQTSGQSACCHRPGLRPGWLRLQSTSDLPAPHPEAAMLSRLPPSLPTTTCRLLPLLLLLAAGGLPGAEALGWTDLSGGKGLDAWKGPTGAWLVASDAELNPDNPRLLRGKPGTGVLVNGARGQAPDLVSKQAFGDAEVHVEFLIPRRSNSGVKLMGLYEIQIYDSWGVKTPTAGDCGGIYPRAELKPVYHHIDKGIPPRVNAAKPPGEWQTLGITFRAPRFDGKGKKTANARFVRVVLNGRVVHEGVEVPTPTGHAWHDPEPAAGPLLLQGDHGPVAFRNVRVRPLPAETKKE
jgi:predicted nucleic acid-binding protein